MLMHLFASVALGDAQDSTIRLAFFIVIPGLFPGTQDGMKKPHISAATGGRDTVHTHGRP